MPFQGLGLSPVDWLVRFQQDHRKLERREQQNGDDIKQQQEKSMVH